MCPCSRGCGGDTEGKILPNTGNVANIDCLSLAPWFGADGVAYSIGECVLSRVGRKVSWQMAAGLVRIKSDRCDGSFRGEVVVIVLC